MTLPAHPLTNFEIQECYQNEPRFNGVFSRDNLPNNNIRPKGLGSAVKNGAYVINLDEYHDIGTHWVALYVNNEIVTYFDSFGVEHILKEIMKFIVRTSFGLQSVTKVVRLAPPSPLFNVGCKFAYLFLVLTANIESGGRGGSW